MPRIFTNEFGRLRSGWRAMLFSAAFLAILLVIVTILRGIYVAVFEFGSLPRLAFLPDFIFRVSLLLAALGGGYVCARWLEGLPWRSLGLTFHQNWLRDLLVGFAIGFVVLAVGVGIAAAGGGVRFSFGGVNTILPIVRSLAGSAFLLCVAALAEEALFRGYVLQTFSRAHLAWMGILVTLVFFAYVHLSNPNATLGMTFINTSIAGLWFGIAYLRTRSLWFPLGLHWAWNWALGAFFGLPVSGMKLVSHPLLSGNDFGPAWLTGGSYGIEGGIAGTIAMVLATVFTWRTRLVSATSELKKLTSEENPVVTSPVVTIRPADDAV
jgi:membrane protease YdiL (CAAX protease family)